MRLETLCAAALLPPLGTVGILLCGDLHAWADKRGGSGDVRGVWKAFARRCAFVAGVAGNHDKFGESPRDLAKFRQERAVHFLDGDCAEVAGARIAGISGVIGNPRRPFRRDEPAFVDAVARLCALRPDFLLMHDGQDVPTLNLKGNPAVRVVLEKAGPELVIRGHAHWDPPLVELAGGTQVLNVDSRVVLLTQEEPPPSDRRGGAGPALQQ